jgi:nucleotide-binding universal stress UspA family protein
VLFAVPSTMIPISSSMRRQGRFPASWYVRTEALPGYGLVGDEAVAVAERWGADLILVGSQGRPNVEPPYFACMSPGVAARAHCPVRIARQRALGGGATPRLLVGIDGSPDAEEAVQELARRTWPRGTAVRVVYVQERAGRVALEGVVPYTGAFLSTFEPRPPAARLAMTRAERALRAAGLEVSTEIRHGDPVGELISAAKAWDANCIVAGSHGLGHMGRPDTPPAGLGDVAGALARRAPLSIEIVRGRPAPASRAAFV